MAGAGLNCVVAASLAHQGCLQGHAAGRDAAGELLTVGFAGLLLVIDQAGPMELVADEDVARFVAGGEEIGNVVGRWRHCRRGRRSCPKEIDSVKKLLEIAQGCCKQLERWSCRTRRGR
ncbi:hypothetical protein ACLOJK_022133 [Asimina triloba]